ncbi:MAG: molybdopterin-dependent oxidoreductase [Firmicutes bacterium]|nr:molybdopterin-dependent oxidoreductase [Bacillota bacterium]
MNNIDYSKGKIPGAQSGIEIRHSVCDICTPGMHCGVDCYVKDGVIVKVEGMKEHPFNKGKLCTKGSGNRQYIYREDRIKTPLKRVGERGEGRFEPISWEEALKTVSDKLLSIRSEYSADHVAFFSGYSKYYRFMLRRLAHSFGTQNYGTESSSCFTAGLMANKVNTGQAMLQNLPNTDLFLAWGQNGYFSRYPLANSMEKAKERGMKVIVVDPRLTPTTMRLADLHLRPHLGTDGALAHAIANVLIQNGWIDRPFIDEHVYGFEAYKEYVSRFTPQEGERLTGVPAEQIRKAAELIHESSSMCIAESSAPICHHRNGMQNYRAIMALTLITGNFDRKGGQIPQTYTFMESYKGFSSYEEEFMDEKFPEEGRPAIGADRFPLWYYLQKDMQANDLADNILRADEHSVKALVAFGMNYRMFPQDEKMLEAFRKLDFFVATDLFMTDTVKYADIVLPACSSFERGEFKCYPGQLVWYTRPAIAPLGEAKSDVDIISLLATEMKLDDPLLCAGYEACVQYIMRDLPLTIKQIQEAEVPFKLQGVPTYVIGDTIKEGIKTPTGKLELSSTILENHPEWGLDPLPTYKEPYNPDPAKYPLRLCAGTRIPNGIHSRLHDVPWERSLLQEPSLEMSMEDAQKYGIELGDDVQVTTNIGCLVFKAIPSATVLEGEIFIYHGYREQDINSILDSSNLDPYSGFPAYRSAFCNIRRV